MYKILIGVTSALGLLLTSSCASILPSFYRIDIRQGNQIDRKLVDQLEPGMSKRQVEFLLGTPLLTDPFHSDRWDYVYNLIVDGKEVENRRLTVFFEGELLKRIEGSVELVP